MDTFPLDILMSLLDLCWYNFLLSGTFQWGILGRRRPDESSGKTAGQTGERGESIQGEQEVLGRGAAAGELMEARQAKKRYQEVV